jgi:hypothetical protein
VNYEWIPCKIKVRSTKAKKMLVSVHETGCLKEEADFLPTGDELRVQTTRVQKRSQKIVVNVSGTPFSPHSPQRTRGIMDLVGGGNAEGTSVSTGMTEWRSRNDLSMMCGRDRPFEN